MALRLTALLCVAAHFVAHGAYPSSYPYENESVVPVAIPEGAPSYTFTTADGGGYVYQYLERSDFALTEDMWPCALANTGVYMYAFVNLWSSPPIINGDLWNCTMKNDVFSAADFTGVINTQKICTVGECCAHLYGNVKFTADLMPWHQALDTKFATNSCGEVDEYVYCMFVGGDYSTDCYEYVLTPETRLLLTPCPDSIYRFYMNCGLFVIKPVVRYPIEPDTYVNTLTNEEVIAIESTSYIFDKVCLPYSYYHAVDQTSETSQGKSDEVGSSAKSMAVVGAAFLIIFV